MHAAVIAGLETIPAIVRELSDDDAVIAMVDANIQREELLPSEKAFAYRDETGGNEETRGKKRFNFVPKWPRSGSVLKMKLAS